MNKYEIYQVGKLPPLTVVEAATYNIDNGFLTFYMNQQYHKDSCIAKFNLNNIAGFKRVRDND